MSVLKRTQLYGIHVAAGAAMVDFGGWEMPIEYPSKIVAEHLYTRHACSLFDVSHMGRVLVDGPEAVSFLQHVLSSNVSALDLNQAQYAIIPNERGGAVDDAYLYRFEEDRYLLVVNAANTDKDLAHLNEQIKNYDARMTVITGDWAAIAVQGPRSKEILQVLSGGAAITEPVKNALNTLQFEGRTVRVAKTGYTGEPIGYEVYIESAEAAWLWNRLIELGAKPAGLGARDTCRLEACLPLYGHEMGADPEGKEIPIFSVPLAKFAVSFSEQKGDFIGRRALERQYAAFKRIQNRDFSDLADQPRRILPIALLDKGVIRAGMPVYKGEKQIPPFYGNPNETQRTFLQVTGVQRKILKCGLHILLPKNLGNHSKGTSRNKQLLCQSAPQPMKTFPIKGLAFNPGAALVILEHRTHRGRILNGGLGCGTPQKQLGAVVLRTGIQNVILYRRPCLIQQRQADSQIRFALLYPDFPLPPVNVRQLQTDDVAGPQPRCRAKKDHGSVPFSDFRRRVDHIQNALQLIIGHIPLNGHLAVDPVGKQFHAVRGIFANLFQKGVEMPEVQKQIV